MVFALEVWYELMNYDCRKEKDVPMTEEKTNISFRDQATTQWYRVENWALNQKKLFILHAHENLRKKIYFLNRVKLFFFAFSI